MIKKLKRILKHFLVPHIGNSFRPHFTRHNSLSVYLFLILSLQIVFGVTLYSGPAVKGIDTEALSQNIISLSNKEREKNNVPNLYENNTLNIAAKQKLNDMFNKNYWDHIGPSGETVWEFIANEGYQYEVAGENLARGFSNPNNVVKAWMDSPTHRENILNTRFQEIGIAVGSGKIKGSTTTIIVQLFGRPKTAFAGAQQQEKLTMGTQSTLMPDFKIENITNPSKKPYFVVWVFIFALIVLDGVMVRKLGLHTSRQHVTQFKFALFMSVLVLAVLSIGFVAIA